MNENAPLQNMDNMLTSNDCAWVMTTDKRVARRLSDHHLALAQIYRELAGLHPIPTGMQQRKMAVNAR